MIRRSRRKISSELSCYANQQRCVTRAKKREGPGAQAFSQDCIVKIDRARQSGVCPKRHARLPATVVKP